MSWKCEECDTYNEDSIDECYVCGSKRPNKEDPHDKHIVKAKRIESDDSHSKKSKDFFDWAKLKYLVFAVIGIPVILLAYELIMIIIHNDYIVAYWNLETLLYIALYHLEDALNNIVLLFQEYISLS